MCCNFFFPGLYNIPDSATAVNITENHKFNTLDYPPIQTTSKTLKWGASSSFYSVNSLDTVFFSLSIKT